MDGYGNISWWGFSPSVDLADHFPSQGEQNGSETGPRECNVLLVNSHDPRHIVHTICQSFRSSTQEQKMKMNFFVLEPFVEQVGRYMLLLNVILDESFGLQEKVETFLEVYGNSMLRNPTAEFVAAQSEKFIKAVTDLELCSQLFPIYDLSLLKHKERDYLEGTFKFWRAADNRNFEIHKMWEFRNREYLGARFDVKENAYDWDRIMKLGERGAAIIQKAEYESFRSKGIAFESRSGDYVIPNRSVSSPVVVTDAKADRVMKRGYFGDIVTGPFISFGAESDNQDLFKKANNVYVNSSLDVTTYNLQQLLKNIPCHQTLIGLDGDQSNSAFKNDVSTFSIKFVYGRDLRFFQTKEKFKGFFDLVLFASDAAQHLNESILPILKTSSYVIVENPKYIVDLKREQVSSILSTLKERAENIGLQLCNQPTQSSESLSDNPFQTNFLKFSRS